MTLALPLLVLLQSSGMMHVPDPGSRETTLQSIVILPKLTAAETSALRLICEVAPRQTEDYIRRDMLAMTDGRPIRMTWMPDHVRLSVTVSGSDSTAVVSITESVLRRASLRQEDLVAASKRLSRPADDRWSAALLSGPMLPFKRREDVVSLYRRLFVPPNIRLVLGGEADPKAAREDWANRTSSWTAPRPPSRRPFDADEPKRPTPSGIVALEGSEFLARDPSLPTRLLALIALGSGKASALHRVWREDRNWSYRQEAVLQPTHEGWKASLIAAVPEPGPKPEEMRQALREDVSRWQETDRVRALGMARGVLLNGVPFSPLYLQPYGPMTGDLEDRTFLAGYWQWKTGAVWDPNRMLELMGMIQLPEMKETALELIG